MKKKMKHTNDKDEEGINNNNGDEAAAAVEGKGKEGAWVVQQMWHRNGTRCPRGTVPIRRSTVADVLRAKSLFDYGKKKQQQPPNNFNFNNNLTARRTDAPDVVSGNGHEVCRAFSLSDKNLHSFPWKHTCHVVFFFFFASWIKLNKKKMCLLISLGYAILISYCIIKRKWNMLDI